jgi:hypothetical protein
VTATDATANSAKAPQSQVTVIVLSSNRFCMETPPESTLRCPPRIATRLRERDTLPCSPHAAEPVISMRRWLSETGASKFCPDEDLADTATRPTDSYLIEPSRCRLDKPLFLEAGTSPIPLRPDYQWSVMADGGGGTHPPRVFRSRMKIGFVSQGRHSLHPKTIREVEQPQVYEAQFPKQTRCSPGS